MDLQHITTCRYFESHPEELLAIARQQTQDTARRLIRRLVAFSKPGDGAMIMSVFTLFSLHAPWLPKLHVINCERREQGTKITLRKLCAGSVEVNVWDPMTFDFSLDECIHTFRTIDHAYLGLYRVEFKGDEDDRSIITVDFVRNPEYSLPVGHDLNPADFIRAMAAIDQEPVSGPSTFVRASARSQASPDVHDSDTIPADSLPDEKAFRIREASSGS